MKSAAMDAQARAGVVVEMLGSRAIYYLLVTDY